MRLAGPNANGTCTSDLMVVVGGASIVPIICGENTGQHMYVDFNGNTSIVIQISTSGSTSVSRAWNIQIAQINCNCPYKGNLKRKSKNIVFFVRYHKKHYIRFLSKNRFDIKKHKCIFCLFYFYMKADTFICFSTSGRS